MVVARNDLLYEANTRDCELVSCRGGNDINFDDNWWCSRCAAASGQWRPSRDEWWCPSWGLRACSAACFQQHELGEEQFVKKEMFNQQRVVSELGNGFLHCLLRPTVVTTVTQYSTCRPK